jgi:L-ascorbate metabolism protein UlaG (beta-lactamase superfamily)
MKISQLIPHLTILLSLCLTPLHARVADTTVSITFIGSAGYIIESPNKKIMIDGIFSDRVKGFDAIYPPAEIVDDWSAGHEEFSGIDVFIFSHVHAGHLQPVQAIDCFKNNPDAVMITTQQSYDEMQLKASDFESVKDRIFVPEIKSYEHFDTTLKEIPFRMTMKPHWGDTWLMVFNFNLEGMEMAFYIGEYDLIHGDHLVKTQNIDVGIIDVDYYMSNQDLMKDFDIQCVTLTHLSYINTKLTSWNNMIETLSNDDSFDWPEFILQLESMEKQVFIKKNGKVTVSNETNMILN